MGGGVDCVVAPMSATAQAPSNKSFLRITSERFGGVRRHPPRPRESAGQVERPSKKSLSQPCPSCGRDEARSARRRKQLAATIYQVVVACASCRTVFAALSRN